MLADVGSVKSDGLIGTRKPATTVMWYPRSWMITFTPEVSSKYLPNHLETLGAVVLLRVAVLEVIKMTRRKKTRSLSRIHNVKTGNIAKLKRASNSDRQSKKRTNSKTKSVYEKFLDENSAAKQSVVAEQERLRKQAEHDSKGIDNPRQPEQAIIDKHKTNKSKINLLDELDNDLDGDIF